MLEKYSQSVTLQTWIQQLVLLSSRLNAFHLSKETAAQDWLLNVSGSSDTSYTNIINWSAALRPFMEHACFIHVTVFNNPYLQLDPMSPLYPTVLRHLSPSLLGDYNSLIWTPRGISISGNDTNIFKKCPHSRFIHIGELSMTLSTRCTLIDYATYALNTRSWKCEVLIGIHPPDYVLREVDLGDIKTRDLGYPGVWHYDPRNNERDFKSFPSRIPHFNTLVQSNERHLEYLASDIYNNG